MIMESSFSEDSLKKKIDSKITKKPVSYQDYTLPSNRIGRVNFKTTAVVQALNKVTAKTSILEIKIGERVEFGNLILVAKKCWKAPSDRRPENKVLLEVFNKNFDKSPHNIEKIKSEIEEKGTNKKRIFYGWMFSSSPSISGLEHPIYDITAISCKNDLDQLKNL